MIARTVALEFRMPWAHGFVVETGAAPQRHPRSLGPLGAPYNLALAISSATDIPNASAIFTRLSKATLFSPRSIAPK